MTQVERDESIFTPEREQAHSSNPCLDFEPEHTDDAHTAPPAAPVTTATVALAWQFKIGIGDTLRSRSNPHRRSRKQVRGTRGRVNTRPVYISPSAPVKVPKGSTPGVYSQENTSYTAPSSGSSITSPIWDFEPVHIDDAHTTPPTPPLPTEPVDLGLQFNIGIGDSSRTRSNHYRRSREHLRGTRGRVNTTRPVFDSPVSAPAEAPKEPTSVSHLRKPFSHENIPDTAPSSDSSANEMTSERRSEQQPGIDYSKRMKDLESLKEEGRTLYTMRDYPASIICYTKAIKTFAECRDFVPNDTLAVLLSNRAAGLIMVGAYEASSEDCRMALRHITPTLETDEPFSSDSGPVLKTKLYTRLGRALLKLGHYNEASAAFDDSIRTARQALALSMRVHDARQYLQNEDILSPSTTEATLRKTEAQLLHTIFDNIAKCTPQSLNHPLDRRHYIEALGHVNSALGIASGCLKLYDNKVSLLSSMMRWREVAGFCERLAADAVRLDNVFTQDLESRYPFPGVPPARTLTANFFGDNSVEDATSVELKLNSMAAAEAVIRLPYSLMELYLRALRLEERYPAAEFAIGVLEALNWHHESVRSKLGWLFVERTKFRDAAAAVEAALREERSRQQEQERQRGDALAGASRKEASRRQDEEQERQRHCEVATAEAASRSRRQEQEKRREEAAAAEAASREEANRRQEQKKRREEAAAAEAASREEASRRQEQERRREEAAAAEAASREETSRRQEQERQRRDAADAAEAVSREEANRWQKQERQRSSRRQKQERQRRDAAAVAEAASREEASRRQERQHSRWQEQERQRRYAADAAETASREEASRRQKQERQRSIRRHEQERQRRYAVAEADSREEANRRQERHRSSRLQQQERQRSYVAGRIEAASWEEVSRRQERQRSSRRKEQERQRCYAADAVEAASREEASRRQKQERQRRSRRQEHERQRREAAAAAEATFMREESRWQERQRSRRQEQERHRRYAADAAETASREEASRREKQEWQRRMRRHEQERQRRYAANAAEAASREEANHRQEQWDSSSYKGTRSNSREESPRPQQNDRGGQRPPPPSDLSKCHYTVLQVRRNATEDEIKKAFHRLALQYHPDKNSDPGASESFRRVKLAYDVLKDSNSKRQYDSSQGSSWNF